MDWFLLRAIWLQYIDTNNSVATTIKVYYILALILSLILATNTVQGWWFLLPISPPLAKKIIIRPFVVSGGSANGGSNIEIQYRKATPQDLESLRSYHISNHLEETTHSEEELETQKSDLQDDFPQLFDDKRFAKGWYYLATAKDNGSTIIIGSVGLDPCPIDNTVVWLNTYSVAKAARGCGVGQYLLETALKQAKQKKMEGVTTIRLVTLKDHSEGFPVMEAARKKYKAAGFEEYKSEEIDFSKTTKITVVWMEKKVMKE